MRPILRLLGTRYGIALVLMLLVLGAVGVTRAVTGSRGTAPPADSVADSATPPRSNLPSGTGDDGVRDPESPTPPSLSTSPGAAPPEEIATAFASAWLNHTGVTADQWRKGMAKYATPALMEQLKEADPIGVPAQRTTGPVQVHSRGPTLVETTIPVDSGTLRLRLLATDGRWLVDWVDWERK